MIGLAPDVGPARQVLRDQQASWAIGMLAPVSTNGIRDALAMQARRERGMTREGDYVRDGGFRYLAATEEKRWELTRDIIERVDPGPYEDPNYFVMLARQASAVEYSLLDIASSPHIPASVLSRILIGTIGQPRNEAYSALIGGASVIAISAGMIEFMYQSEKAVVHAWKESTPPEGRSVSFSGRPEDTAEVLESNLYPVDLFFGTLAAWLYDGRPRPPGRVPPDPHRALPLGMLVNGAERFVIAHEYGHVLVDQLGAIAMRQSAEETPWDKEFRADAFAFLTVSISSRALDQLPPNMALQGAVVAMKANEIVDEALDIARTGRIGTRTPSASHPAFTDRLAQLEQAYLNFHPEPDQARKDLAGMQVPGQTLTQLWERAQPRLVEQFRAGRRLHPIWRDSY